MPSFESQLLFFFLGLWQEQDEQEEHSRGAANPQAKGVPAALKEQPELIIPAVVPIPQCETERSPAEGKGHWDPSSHGGTHPKHQVCSAADKLLLCNLM